MQSTTSSISLPGRKVNSQVKYVANKIILQPLRLFGLSRSSSSIRRSPCLSNHDDHQRSLSEQCLSQHQSASKTVQSSNNVKQVQAGASFNHFNTPHSLYLRGRRNILISRRRDGKFGFTVQSYLFERPESNTRDRTTYVDHVAIDSPAFDAGLRCGDVILSVNGTHVHDFTHRELMHKISDSKSLHMTVLFSNNMEKIELYTRCIKLLNLLADKEFELSVLERQEERLRKKMPPLTGEQMLHFIKKDFESTESVNIPPLHAQRTLFNSSSLASGRSLPLVKTRHAIDDYDYLRSASSRQQPVYGRVSSGKMLRSVSDAQVQNNILPKNQQESTRL